MQADCSHATYCSPSGTSPPASSGSVLHARLAQNVIELKEIHIYPAGGAGEACVAEECQRRVVAGLRATLDVKPPVFGSQAMQKTGATSWRDVRSFLKIRFSPSCLRGHPGPGPCGRREGAHRQPLQCSRERHWQRWRLAGEHETGMQWLKHIENTRQQAKHSMGGSGYGRFF